MKFPKTRRTYCPYCRKHTVHKVLESKKKGAFAAHPLARASFLRAKLRGRIGIGNAGKYSKPPISKWKRTGVKQSKKTDLRYLCTECKKQHTQRQGFRVKRIEFVEK